MKSDAFWQGKCVLITGASKGIGAAAAQAFAEEGCDLELAARSEALLRNLAGRLTADYGIKAYIHAVDLRQSPDVKRLGEIADRIDVLVNNAGDIPPGTLETIDEDTWRHSWDLKVFGYINLTRIIYRAMKKRGRGVIINDIGMAGERADPNYIAGSSGNAALMAFTRALGARSPDDGIRVVAINPGPVETERTAQFMNRLGDRMGTFPFGRFAHPREIADLMVFLASDRSAYTSGAIFTVDGGISARS